MMKSQHTIVLKKSICRASILKAARKIITEHNWVTLSMRYLAKAINYTAPILYNYFPAKEDLVSALVEMGYSLLIRQIKTAWKRYEKPGLQLNAAWLAYWKFGKSEKWKYIKYLKMKKDLTPVILNNKTLANDSGFVGLDWLPKPSNSVRRKT
jgi:AcrR family transcriptional regulator